MWNLFGLTSSVAQVNICYLAFYRPFNGEKRRRIISDKKTFINMQSALWSNKEQVSFFHFLALVLTVCLRMNAVIKTFAYHLWWLVVIISITLKSNFRLNEFLFRLETTFGLWFRTYPVERGR